MEVRLYLKNDLVPSAEYCHITAGKVNSVSQVLNLLAFLNSKAIQYEDTRSIEFFINSLKQHLQIHNNPDEVSRMMFLLEQMKLSLSSKHSRRYSPELLVFAYLNYAVSPAAYTILSSY